MRAEPEPGLLRRDDYETLEPIRCVDCFGVPVRLRLPTGTHGTGSLHGIDRTWS